MNNKSTFDVLWLLVISEHKLLCRAFQNLDPGQTARICLSAYWNPFHTVLGVLREGKGTTEDEMVGWHQQLDRHEFDQAPGDGDGQGNLACYSPWGCKESDMTEQLNWTELILKSRLHHFLPCLCNYIHDLIYNMATFQLLFTFADEYKVLGVILGKHWAFNKWLL